MGERARERHYVAASRYMNPYRWAAAASTNGLEGYWL